jgi:hypothetical protein
MIFGFGRGSNNFRVPETNQIILTTFIYFHILFLFRLTFGRKWFLVENIKLQDKDQISITQKPISLYKVNEILNKKLVHFGWVIINQSLIWLIVFIIIFEIFKKTLTLTLFIIKFFRL